nr:Hypothetical protein [Astacus astacus]
MEDASLPSVPSYAGRKHQSLTNTGEQRWQRRMLAGTIVMLLSSVTLVVQQIADDRERLLNQTLDAFIVDIDQRIAFIFEEAIAASQDEIDHVITEIRDLQDLTSLQTSKISDTLTQLKHISTRADDIIVQLAEMESVQAGTAATLTLVWKQFTNFLAMFSDFQVQLSEEWSLTASRDGARNTLLDSILSEVTYEATKFRRKVRTALIGTTIVATTEYEAGGQCDIIPEECTLIGETEIEVEDVLGV